MQSVCSMHEKKTPDGRPSRSGEVRPIDELYLTDVGCESVKLM
jgi:hypothetical protein